MVRDKRRSRKPRVTLERKITWSAIAEETGTLLLVKRRGARYLIRWDISRFDSDENVAAL
jgi:hypothetical protein